MSLRYVILGTALLASVQGRVKDPQKVHVDQFRYDFLNLEDKLWNFVDDLISNGLKDGEHPEVSLIREFQRYGNKIQEV